MPAAESQRFAQYLLGRAFAQRAAEDGAFEQRVEALYARACAALKLDQADRPTRFVARHTWALGPVDAAAALLAPDCVLRRRLLALAAILETTPQFAPQFTPRVASPVGFAAGFIYLGLIASLRLAAGLILWPYLRSLR